MNKRYIYIYKNIRLLPPGKTIKVKRVNWQLTSSLKTKTSDHQSVKKKIK